MIILSFFLFLWSIDGVQSPHHRSRKAVVVVDQKGMKGDEVLGELFHPHLHQIKPAGACVASFLLYYHAIHFLPLDPQVDFWSLLTYLTVCLSLYVSMTLFCHPFPPTPFYRRIPQLNHLNEEERLYQALLLAPPPPPPSSLPPPPPPSSHPQEEGLPKAEWKRLVIDDDEHKGGIQEDGHHCYLNTSSGEIRWDLPSDCFVECIDETSGTIYFFHTKTGEAILKRSGNR